MGSFDLQLWTHIGAMNRHSAVRCPRFSVSLRFGHPKGWTPNRRFMESLTVQIWTRIGSMNHEGKTSNIEHRTLKTRLPRENFRRSRFEVQSSKFKVHWKKGRFMESRNRRLTAARIGAE